MEPAGSLDGRALEGGAAPAAIEERTAVLVDGAPLLEAAAAIPGRKLTTRDSLVAGQALAAGVGGAVCVRHHAADFLIVTTEVLELSLLQVVAAVDRLDAVLARLAVGVRLARLEAFAIFPFFVAHPVLAGGTAGIAGRDAGAEGCKDREEE